MSIAPPAPPSVSLPIQGSDDRFYLRRIYCVGRNYADHAREMGNDPDREPPFFFSKPADAVFAAEEGIPSVGIEPGVVPYPPQTGNLHFEIELVVAIGQDTTGIEPSAALDHVWGYGVGVDLTRRDLQDEAKAMRRPWELSKGFDASGPTSPLLPVAAVGHPDKGKIWLSVDGEPRQQGDLNAQTWPVPDMIAYLSQYVVLRAGDLIFTGTPAGVGAIVSGNRVNCGIEGVAEFEFVVK